VLAVRRSADPAFVLGAMLPDFATMIRARPPVTEHAAIDLGMRFHWRTDDAFHRSEAFGDLTHAAVRWLSARGVRSGSALAAAHVGVEILLDAALAGDAPAQQAYWRRSRAPRRARLGATSPGRPTTRRCASIICASGCASAARSPATSRRTSWPAVCGARSPTAPAWRWTTRRSSAVREWVTTARTQVSNCAAPLVQDLAAQLSVDAQS